MEQITVLLPIYRESDNYVKCSLDSILNQSFKDFRIFVNLDDPSNERLKKLMNEYRLNYKCIEFRVNEKNLGLPLTLNDMLERVETPYIARMDADDIAFSDRFKLQYEFMKTHPEIDLCGTNMIYIDESGSEIHRKGNIPEKPDDITWALRYVDVLCHPTFFAKSSVMKKIKYRSLRYSQDYDLVCRLAIQGYKLANLNEYLLSYRISNVSMKKKFEQRIIAGLIKQFYTKGSLCNFDIEKETEKVLKNSSEKEMQNYYHAAQMNEQGVIQIKNKQYIRGLGKIICSTLVSKYERQDFLMNLKYRTSVTRL